MTFFVISSHLPDFNLNDSFVCLDPLDSVHHNGHKIIFTAGLVEVIIYSSPDDKKKNRGFCFLEYESHKAASLAKRRLGTGRIKVYWYTFFRIIFQTLKLLYDCHPQVWNCDIIVDWADPQEEPDEKTMSKVKVLYVRNLTQDTSEEKLKVSEA